ncbi:MAG: hypothetical protein A4E19_04365 [Nitrospira sp. SG-bin1]|nr:MAG: hypothetical protein A4E19_04365 [Nitrospira sp. SG-bin1]
MAAGSEVAIQKPLKPRNAASPMIDGPRRREDGRLWPEWELSLISVGFCRPQLVTDRQDNAHCRLRQIHSALHEALIRVTTG